MKKPNVTIIISNYNYGEYVLDAINSALKQTYPCKVVVIDDGSTDHTKSIISAVYYFDALLKTNDGFDVLSGDQIDFIVTPNRGASAARNTAISWAWPSTDVFAILDADDMYGPNKVERLVEALSKHDEIGVAYADYIIERTGDQKYVKYEYKHPYSLQELKQHCIVHSGALIKKKYLEKVILPNGEIYDTKLHGPLSKGFVGCTEDYDLWLRLARQCVMVHVPEPLSIVRETGKNQSMRMTQDIFNNNMGIIQSR